MIKKYAIVLMFTCLMPIRGMYYETQEEQPSQIVSCFSTIKERVMHDIQNPINHETFKVLSYLAYSGVIFGTSLATIVIPDNHTALYTLCGMGLAAGIYSCCRGIQAKFKESALLQELQAQQNQSLLPN
jgi:hypothetical protein